MMEINYFASRHTAFLALPDNAELVDLSTLNNLQAIFRVLCTRFKGADSHYGLSGGYHALRDSLYDWIDENHHKAKRISLLMDRRKLSNPADRDYLEKLPALFNEALSSSYYDASTGAVINVRLIQSKIHFYFLIIR